MIPHASPSVMAHPCICHFHLEHDRKQVFVAEESPGAGVYRAGHCW